MASSPARAQARPRAHPLPPGQRLGAYLRLARLHRPIGILLLLWPMLWALWLAAGGVPHLDVLAIFVAGTVLMRSAGCVINDFADRHFDGHVERTRERPLATGEVSEREALVLFALLTLAAALLVLLTNRLTILLACGGIALAVTYPYAKRYTYLPQLHLGAAFGWAVPMAFAAQAGALTPLTWLTFCATVLWAVIYDTEYAMVDRDDDLALGIKSTAILFGDDDRLVIGVLQVIMLLNLLLIGDQAGLGWPFHLGLAAAAALFGYQQYLIRGRARPACFTAFLNNNWVGGVIFAGIAASHALGAVA
ncbi:MAG: 4-hydroxybenzoate octaprenyltransferase [Gammaproteobacteria bacterium]|nr:4-hydroxybenzoate octaprenyltransferase [Gammaproteobacteria bacterium]